MTKFSGVSLSDESHLDASLTVYLAKFASTWNCDKREEHNVKGDHISTQEQMVTASDKADYRRKVRSKRLSKWYAYGIGTSPTVEIIQQSAREVQILCV